MHCSQEILEVMKKFLQKMIYINYDVSLRKEIVKAAVKKYHWDLARAAREGKSLYRSCKKMDEVRGI